MAIKRQVFYSFHYDKDVFRVQQIRNIGALEDNKPVTPNEWEQVKRGGDRAIEKWIDENMKYKSCVVVLVGEETHQRPWVRYEIKKAWNEGKGLLGIHINNIKCMKNGTCNLGVNPFSTFNIGGTSLSNIVQCYSPTWSNPYNHIKENLEDWVETAIKIRANHR